MLLSVLKISLLGGLIYLDRTAVLQIMISRPIVIGPILGMILGNPQLGLKMGVILELLWLNMLPIGSNIPPDDSFASIAAIGGGILINKNIVISESVLISFITIISVPFAIFGQKIDITIRRFNIILSRKAYDDLEKGKPIFAEKGNLIGVLNHYIVIALGLFLILIILVPTLTYLLPILPNGVVWSLEWTYNFLPFLGLAVIFCTYDRRKSLIYFISGFLLAFTITSFLF